MFGATEPTGTGVADEAGDGLPGTLEPDFGNALLLRKNTAVTAANNTSAEPVSPKRKGVQYRPGCAVLLRDLLLTSFHLSN